MITPELAKTEIAEMMSSLNNVMAADPENFKDREHLGYVSTSLAWVRGNADGTDIEGREIKDIFLPLRIKALRDDMVKDLTSWASGTDFPGHEGSTVPDGYLLALYMESLPYTDAETETTDGTLVVSFVTRAFSNVVAFDLVDGQFVERALKGTLPTDITTIAAPSAETIH